MKNMFDEEWFNELSDEWKENMESFKEMMCEFKHNMPFSCGFHNSPRHHRPHGHHRPRGFGLHFLGGCAPWMHNNPFMKDEPDKYVLRIPLWKYTKDEVKVQASQKKIVIRFEKEGKKPRLRYIPLHPDVDPAKINAKVEDDKLVINMYKKNPDVDINIE